MSHSRRSFLKTLGANSAALVVQGCLGAEPPVSSGKPHIVTLSFDDGFKKSFTRTAEIYEKHKLSACLNIVAAGLPEDAYIQSTRTAWMTRVGDQSAPRTSNGFWRGCSLSGPWRSSRRGAHW